MKQLVLVIVGLALFGFLMLRLVLAEAAVECEACMEFQGRHACGSVAAPDRREATVRAVSQACSTISTGVTQTLACERRAPVSLECRTR